MAAIFSNLDAGHGGPWAAAAEAESAMPDRMVYADVRCRHLIPNPDSVNEELCGWAGQAAVAVWIDTREALWVCPSEHENNEDWADFA